MEGFDNEKVFVQGVKKRIFDHAFGDKIGLFSTNQATKDLVPCSNRPNTTWNHDYQHTLDVNETLPVGTKLQWSLNYGNWKITALLELGRQTSKPSNTTIRHAFPTEGRKDRVVFVCVPSWNKKTRRIPGFRWSKNDVYVDPRQFSTFGRVNKGSYHWFLSRFMHNRIQNNR